MTEKTAQAGEMRQQAEEVEERRRGAVLIILGLAALLGAFWGGLILPAAAGGGAGVGGVGPEAVGVGNVVLVGFNGTQRFVVWAPPGSVVVWDVAFCNVADGDVVASVKLVDLPREFRRFRFYVNGSWFGWDGVNMTGWSGVFRRGLCLPGKLEVLVDGRAAPGGVYAARAQVEARPLGD